MPSINWSYSAKCWPASQNPAQSLPEWPSSRYTQALPCQCVVTGTDKKQPCIESSSLHYHLLWLWEVQKVSSIYNQVTEGTSKSSYYKLFQRSACGCEVNTRPFIHFSKLSYIESRSKAWHFLFQDGSSCETPNREELQPIYHEGIAWHSEERLLVENNLRDLISTPIQLCHHQVLFFCSLDCPFILNLLHTSLFSPNPLTFHLHNDDCDQRPVISRLLTFLHFCIYKDIEY